MRDDRITELLDSRLTPVIENVFNKFMETFSTKLEGFVEGSANDLIVKHCELQSRKITELESVNVLL